MSIASRLVFKMGSKVILCVCVDSESSLDWQEGSAVVGPDNGIYNVILKS